MHVVGVCRALNYAHRARHSRSGSGPLASLGLHGPSARQASRRSLRRAGPSHAHASRARPRSQTARARPARVRRSLRGFVRPWSSRCSARHGPCISGPVRAERRKLRSGQGPRRASRCSGSLRASMRSRDIRTSLYIIPRPPAAAPSGLPRPCASHRLLDARSARPPARCFCRAAANYLL
jgi:hypothetical protein